MNPPVFFFYTSAKKVLPYGFLLIYVLFLNLISKRRYRFTDVVILHNFLQDKELILETSNSGNIFLWLSKKG